MRRLLKTLSIDDFTPTVEDREAVMALAQFNARFQVNRKGRVFGVSIGKLSHPDCLSWLPSLSELISFAVAELYASMTWFGDAELAALRELSNLKAIAAIGCKQLTGNDIHRTTGRDSLRWLTLAECQIGDEGIMAISSLPELFRLVIPGCVASDESLRLLIELKNLRQLDLRDTKASSSTIELLANALPRCRIKA